MEVGKESIDLGIIVNDVAGCRQFYGEALGLPFEAEMPLPDGAKMFRYKIGTTVLKLVQPPQPVPASPVGMRAQSGLRYFTITVNDLDKTVAALTAQGREFTVPLREFRPGVRIAILPDPDGNMVELLEMRP